MIPKLIFKSRTTEVNTASDNIQMAYQKGSFETDTHMVNIFGELQTESNHLTTANKSQ